MDCDRVRRKANSQRDKKWPKKKRELRKNLKRSSTGTSAPIAAPTVRSRCSLVTGDVGFFWFARRIAALLAA
jgi:hypothetical protein